ncbi:MAG: FAD-dependent oxidoreductase, partial [Acidobacteriota bacterium]
MNLDLDLPRHLAERRRLLGDGSINPNGAYVLYWMHHAVRSHDNPALDAAVVAGNALGLPVVVYQGLSSKLPFASDRHYTFMLEGARDVARELGERGIKHVFFLAPRREDREPLLELAEGAALVVVEDFPAPPYPRWTQKLVEATTTAVWAVDASCVVPMQLAGRSFGRAFEFRRAIQGELDRRLDVPWRDVEPEVPAFDGDPGFETQDLKSIDLATADFAELCARCEIDHAVGPVPETRGGSVAGYARWQAFQESGGLKRYARRRNDAAIDGVSRMSPYLHHGHVSPFRIAREAAEAGHDGARRDGARKFLDELLIWRELAFNFCFYESDPERFGALPGWARETLERHARDEREAIYSWEQLARAGTGDPLWDAAQTSLLIHGELHNNVRMTWGKALLRWTRTPQDALRLLIDLNHRYALDGSDPASYGGLLWCLGLFDRPFTPERPVIGTVRSRSSARHAQRLDLDRYRARVQRPARPGLTVAVIGAGLSGLFAARTLADHGLEVQVFDKARGPGGRMSTRRALDLRFDHGAQYFTVRDPRFERYVNSWIEDGVIARWDGRIAVVEGGHIEPKADGPDRFVGVPGMNAACRHLASDVNVAYGRRVETVERQDGGWRLIDDQGRELGDFSAVIVSAPPAQAAPLLAGAPQLSKAADGVAMQPSWAVMTTFDQPLELPFDGAFVNDSPLSWVARNSSKPDRPESDSWVLHASPAWSTQHLELEAEDVAGRLLEAFFEATGREPVEP